MKGRKPVPTTIKLLSGRKGRGINYDEPKIPRAKSMSPPSHLSADAKREWRRIAPRLEQTGVLTVGDRAILAAYCQAYGRWVQAEKQIEAFLTEGKTRQHPMVGVANRAMELMHKFALELGLTPVSRARIHAGHEDEEVDRLDRYLSRKAAR